MNGLIGIATLRCRTHTNEQKRKVPGTNCDNISDVFARFLTQRMFPKVHTTLVGYGGVLDGFRSSGNGSKIYTSPFTNDTSPK
jgi:hypothetical protein